MLKAACIRFKPSTRGLFPSSIPYRFFFHTSRTTAIAQSKKFISQIVMSKRTSTELELPTFNPNKKKQQVGNPIVWIDCEMTGLDVYKDNIIEICCIITDGDMNLLHEGYESVIHVDKEILDSMDPWCVNQHGSSGLTQKVLESKKTLKEVEEELLDYVQTYTKKGKAVLAGNTVHMDRAFMMRELPKVIDHLHYRIIDVSSFFEFGRRHNPELINQCPKKRNSHTARDDILESIAQLAWFRDHYMIGPETQKILEDAKTHKENQKENEKEKDEENDKVTGARD